MTAQRIQLIIMQCLHTRATVVNNINLPTGEADVFAILQSGYTAEYEVKISRSDFKADDKKVVRYARLDGWKAINRKKHDMLRDGYEKGPNRFYYVTPPDMVSEDEIPSHAGLIYVTKKSIYDGIEIVKRAPLLHKKPITQEMLIRLLKRVHARYYETLFQRELFK